MALAERASSDLHSALTVLSGDRSLESCWALRARYRLGLVELGRAAIPLPWMRIGRGHMGKASYTSTLPPDCRTGHPSAFCAASVKDSALTIV